MNKFEILQLAYRGRIFYNTDQEFTKMWSVKFETIAAKCDNASIIHNYYDIFNSRIKQFYNLELADLVEDYLKASQACNEGIDWKERWQLASRKKFCRKLLRMYVAPGVELSVKEELKFSHKDCDSELLQTFCPDGINGVMKIDPFWTTLITFGVVPPLNPNACRSHDVEPEAIRQSLDKMKILLHTLMEDLPGSEMRLYRKAFEICLGIIDATISDLDECANINALHFWSMLRDLFRANREVWSPLQRVHTSLIPDRWHLPGIWVDDSNNEQGRFWIFPDNLSMAFRFMKEKHNWMLDVFEFSRITENNGKHSPKDPVGGCFITAKFFRQIAFDHLIPASDGIITLTAKPQTFDQEGDITAINFEHIEGRIPTWCDWLRFTRLERDTPIYNMYRDTLARLYDPTSVDSRLLDNRGAILSDMLDGFIGADRDYLYIQQPPTPIRFLMKETDSPDHFQYIPDYGGNIPKMNLLETTVSYERPLFAIPRHPKQSKLNQFIYRYISEVIASCNLDSSIIYLPAAGNRSTSICFAKMRAIVPLEDLIDYGAKVCSFQPKIGV